MKSFVVSLVLICFWAGPVSAQTGEWTFHGSVAQGAQIDAVRGPNDRIHLVAGKYYQFDADCNVVTEENHGDERQGSMDFPPAIAVGGDGSVHLVTRHGGDWTSGHDIRYRRRNSSGNWDRDYTFGARHKRNYVVAAAAASGNAYMMYSEGGDDVWGDLHLFEAGDSSATDLGRISGVWRADADARMRGDAGTVFLVSGKCDPNGAAYFMHAGAGANLRANLEASLQVHSSGSDRKGFPDLYVDPTGEIHFTYGARHTVWYNRYNSSGQKAFGNDIQIFDGLGDWHMSIGLSAVAASDDGQTVVAVALLSDGSQAASDSDILWNYSTDAGATWNQAEDLGKNTTGGEGRCRPRLVAVGNKFFLFFVDNAASGISLATLEFTPTVEEEPQEEEPQEEEPRDEPDAGGEEPDEIHDAGDDAGTDAGTDEPADSGDTDLVGECGCGAGLSGHCLWSLLGLLMLARRRYARMPT
jgi:hypothetical protein